MGDLYGVCGVTVELAQAGVTAVQRIVRLDWALAAELFGELNYPKGCWPKSHIFGSRDS